MRSSLMMFITVAAALLAAPLFASADDVGGGDDLQEVISRMSDLEQKLQATNDALAASNAKVDQQQKMLSKLEPSSETGPMLALSDFLSETTFEGWVAASYFYNLNNPDNGRNIGSNAGTIGANPHHQNHNSFQVDQVWFSMSNEATNESRGGFEIDIVYGETGDQLAVGFEGHQDHRGPLREAHRLRDRAVSVQLQHHARPALHASAGQLYGREALVEVRERHRVDDRFFEQLGLRDTRHQPVRGRPERPELRHGRREDLAVARGLPGFGLAGVRGQRSLRR